MALTILIFFTVLLFAILIIYMIYKITTWIIQPNTPSIPKNVKSQKNIKDNSDYLYKEKEIRPFEISGLFYRKLDIVEDSGLFIGHACTTYNVHDKYCVEIFNKKNKSIGFIPKGNRRLFESLSQWHNGKIFIWGQLFFEEYYNNWKGTVYIPVGFSVNEIEDIKKFFSLQNSVSQIISSSNKTTQSYITFLNLNSEIALILKKLNYPAGLNYYAPSTILASISKLFEKEKMWQELINLESEIDLLKNLPENYKKATKRRIELAKNKITPHNQNY
jgi:hypothetical protein